MAGLLMLNINYLNAQEECLMPSQDLQQIILADQLVIHGYRQSDPFALLNAARIYYELNIRPLEIEKTETLGGKVDTSKLLTSSTNPVRLTKDAEGLAKENEDELLVKLAQKVNNDVSVRKRGVTEGLAGLRNLVPAKSAQQLWLTLEGGKESEIMIIGSGDSDLDLYLCNESDEEIISDDTDTDNCFLSFTPEKNMPVIIKVVNEGNKDNFYFLTIK